MSKIRLHITLPLLTGLTFSKVIPIGMRSLIIRELIELILDAINTYGVGIISLLINGEIKIVPKHSNGQNLTTTDMDTQDGQQPTNNKSNSNVV